MTTITGDTIKLRPRFNQEIDEKLMKKIGQCRKIIFNDYYNQDLPQLPNVITHITFGIDYNKPIHNLPRSLIYLKMGRLFNNFVENLPDSLIYLEFDEWFCCRISYFPPALQYLDLGHVYNYPLDNLPQSLKFLRLGNIFDNRITNIPASLEVLITGLNFSDPLFDLPYGIKFVVFSNSYRHSIQNLPDSIEVLAIGYFYCNDDDKYEGVYGERIKQYYWWLGKNEKITRLPRNLKYLYLHPSYQGIENIKAIFPNVIVSTEKNVMLEWIYQNTSVTNVAISARP